MKKKKKTLKKKYIYARLFLPPRYSILSGDPWYTWFFSFSFFFSLVPTEHGRSFVMYLHVLFIFSKICFFAFFLFFVFELWLNTKLQGKKVTKKSLSLVWWPGSGSQHAGWRRSGPDKTYMEGYETNLNQY